MTRFEEFLLARMSVRRWLLAAISLFFAGIVAGSFLGRHGAPHPATPEVSGTTPAAVVDKTPTIQEFNAFCARFVPQVKAQLEAMRATSYQSAGSKFEREMEEVREDMNVKLDCTLHSTDLRRTESIAHPIVGIAQIKILDAARSKTDNYTNATLYLYTVTLAPAKNNKWQVTRVVQKVLDVQAFPDDPHARSRIGKESDIVLDWMKAASTRAQQ